LAAENDATYRDLVEALSKGFPQSKTSLKEASVIIGRFETLYQ